MTTYKVLTDAHAYGPQAIMTDQQVHEALGTQKDVIYIGDNVDMRNCKRDDLPQARVLLSDCVRLSKQFVPGNHELNQIKMSDFYVVNGVLFTHGDYLFWTQDKANKFRASAPGAGFFRRDFIVEPLNLLREIINAKVSDYFLDQVNFYAARFFCNTVVCGHKHPKETMTGTTSAGIKYIVLKRGLNTVEV